jgi:hypothetical protein
VVPLLAVISATSTLGFLVSKPTQFCDMLHIVAGNSKFAQIINESESYVTTDGQSASLSWNKVPIWGLRPDFYYCQIVAGLLMCGALSDDRTGLPFTIAAGARQRSHSRV